MTPSRIAAAGMILFATLAPAAAEASGWSGWSGFYRSFAVVPPPSAHPVEVRGKTPPVATRARNDYRGVRLQQGRVHDTSKPTQHYAAPLDDLPNAPGRAPRDRVTDWRKAQELRSGKVTMWDHNFEAPPAETPALRDKPPLQLPGGRSPFSGKYRVPNVTHTAPKGAGYKARRTP